MNAKTWFVLLCVVVFACAWCAAPCLADDEPPPMGGDAEDEDGEADVMAEMAKRMDAMLKGLSSFVGETRLTEESVQSILKHAASFHESGRKSATDQDAVEKLLEESFRTKGVYDFGLLLGVKELQAWAKARALDAGSWMRTLLRAQGLYMRAEMIAGAEAARKQVAEQLAQLESMRKPMGEEGYQAARAALDAAVKMAEESAKRAKDAIPGPTEVEAKLLAKHGKALQTAVEGPDDGGDADDEGEDDGR